MSRFSVFFFSLFFTLFTVTGPLSAANPHDRAGAIAKLRHDLDRAMSRGTPTDKEIQLLRKSRTELNSTSKEDFDAAIDEIDKIAHTQSFKSQDAADLRKDIGDIKGRWSFLPLHKK